MSPTVLLLGAAVRPPSCTNASSMHEPLDASRTAVRATPTTATAARRSCSRPRGRRASRACTRRCCALRPRIRPTGTSALRRRRCQRAHSTAPPPRGTAVIKKSSRRYLRSYWFAALYDENAKECAHKQLQSGPHRRLDVRLEEQPQPSHSRQSPPRHGLCIDASLLHSLVHKMRHSLVHRPMSLR